MEELTNAEMRLIETMICWRIFNQNELAKKLGVSPTTIRSHFNNIYLKLNLPENNMASIVWWYYNKE